MNNKFNLLDEVAVAGHPGEWEIIGTRKSFLGKRQYHCRRIDLRSSTVWVTAEQLTPVDQYGKQRSDLTRGAAE